MRVWIGNCMRTVRDDLKRLIDDQPDMQSIGDADGDPGGLQVVEMLNPDVVVLDFQNSFRQDTEAVNRMRSLRPGLKIIALCMHSDPRYLGACLHAGVSGYVLKDCAGEELVDAVRTVAADRFYLSRSLEPPIDPDLPSTPPIASSSAVPIPGLI
jgi:DNA-binding NarL/FixJ family response regulator